MWRVSNKGAKVSNGWRELEKFELELEKFEVRKNLKLSGES